MANTIHHANPAPLDGLLVVDFSQFLAGPFATLRLQDMGARVIKVENPNGGDLCRRIYHSDTDIRGESTLFHAINRGKQSICLDLKSSQGIAQAKQLLQQADVVVQNFRPGVIEKLGLSYEQLHADNPKLVYGSISGYGSSGLWSEDPGQDLLAQARSGVMWLSGNADHGPVPIGLPLADISAGQNLLSGILAALFQRERKGLGNHVQTSLLESLLDLQFEFLTTYLNNGERHPQRLPQGSAHGYLSAPYGVYSTKQGYLALAMTPLEELAKALHLPALDQLTDKQDAFMQRETIYACLNEAFQAQTAQQWEQQLMQQGIWCAEVIDWQQTLQQPTIADMVASINTEQGVTRFMTSPIRFGEARMKAAALAPELDQHHDAIAVEFGW